MTILRAELIGRDGDDVEAVAEFCEWHIHYVGRGGISSFAMAAIDIALWDIRCRKANLPLWKVAGGAGRTCRVYGGGIDLKFPFAEAADPCEGVFGSRVQCGENQSWAT